MNYEIAVKVVEHNTGEARERTFIVENWSQLAGAIGAWLLDRKQELDALPLPDHKEVI